MVGDVQKGPVWGRLDGESLSGWYMQDELSPESLTHYFESRGTSGRKGGCHDEYCLS